MGEVTLLGILATGKEILSYVSLGIDLKDVISDYVKSNSKMDALVNKAVNQARRGANIDSQHYYGKPLSDEILKEELLDLVQKKATNVLNDEEIPNWLGKSGFEKFYDSMMQDVGFWNYLHQQIESRQHLLQLGMLAESEQLLKKIEAQIEILSQHSSKLPEWFSPYDEELKADRKRTFLHQATVSLIEQGKVFRGAGVEKVKGFLNSNNVCLVKAPEGRGKTFLSRIVAFDFHAERKEVFFVDFTKIDDKYDQLERIKDVLNIWKNNKYTNYFLVLENVHACQKLSELIEVIEDWRCFDAEMDKGNVQFLLNTRPTDEGVDCFNEWEEVVELKPDREAIAKVIEIYFGEANGRQPFENEDSKKAFVNNICKEGDIRNGTNLRLLGYYLMTWLGDSSIEYVSDVNESKIIEKVK